MSVLRSSAERRIMRFRHDLVLSLYLRDGQFWEAVSGLRAKWEVCPECVIPSHAHLRAELRHAPNLAVDPEDPFAPHPDSDENIESTRAWFNDLEWLLRVSIPDDLLPDLSLNMRLFAEMDWRDFVGACVLYDPPPAQLFEFAYAVPVRLTTIGTATAGILEETPTSPGMLAPPIETLYGRGVEYLATAAYYEALIGEIAKTHLEPLGLDIRHIRREIHFENPDILNLREATLAAFPLSHYISVDSETTDADVRNARRMIVATLPPTDPTATRARDDLLSVQLAIWHYECGLTHKQIAECLDWPLTRDEYGVPRRSDRVRDHIRAGRELIGRK